MREPPSSLKHVWWPIAANQKKIKITKIKTENKKIKQIKKILFRKKTPQNYHGP